MLDGPERVGVLGQHRERRAVELQPVPDVGAHVADPQHHRLTRRGGDDRVHLPVDGARRRRVGVDVLGDDRRALELHVAQRDQVLGDEAQVGREPFLEPADDQRAREAGEDLLLRETVQVRVVPVGAGRDVGGHLDRHRIVRGGGHDAQHVVGDADRRRVESVGVEVGRFGQVVLHVDLDVVARVHHQRRAEESGAVGLALYLLAGHLVGGLVDVEGRAQHAELAADHGRLDERPALLRGERRLHDATRHRGARRTPEPARVGRRRGGRGRGLRATARVARGQRQCQHGRGNHRRDRASRDACPPSGPPPGPIPRRSHRDRGRLPTRTGCRRSARGHRRGGDGSALPSIPWCIGRERAVRHGSSSSSPRQRSFATSLAPVAGAAAGGKRPQGRWTLVNWEMSRAPADPQYVPGTASASQVVYSPRCRSGPCAVRVSPGGPNGTYTVPGEPIIKGDSRKAYRLAWNGKAAGYAAHIDYGRVPCTVGDGAAARRRSRPGTPRPPTRSSRSVPLGPTRPRRSPDSGCTRRREPPPAPHRAAPTSA